MLNETFIEKLKNLNPKGRITVQSPNGQQHFDLADIVKDDKLDALVIHLAPYDKNYLDNVDIHANDASSLGVINQNAPSDHFNQAAIDKGVKEQESVLNDETPKMRTVPADDPASEKARVENTKNLSKNDERKLQDLFKNDRLDKSGDKKRSDVDKSGGDLRKTHGQHNPSDQEGMYMSKKTNEMDDITTHKRSSNPINPELDPLGSEDTEDTEDDENTENDDRDLDLGYQTGKSGEVKATAKPAKGPNPAMESSLPTVGAQNAPSASKDKYQTNPKDDKDKKHHNKK